MNLLFQLGAPAVLFVAIILVLILVRSFRIAQEYERAVIFSLGRVTSRPRGPGLFIVLPWERAQKVDIRTVTLAIPSQDCITGESRRTAVEFIRCQEVAA